MSAITYQWGTCMDKSCKRPATVPQFTKPLRDIREGDVQPRWYCTTCTNKHPNVSPVDGSPRVKQRKAYIKKQGALVPLKVVPKDHAPMKEGGDDGKVAQTG